MYRVNTRLYLDSTGTRIVEGPPDAAVLYKAKGGEVTEEELEMWGDQLKRYIPELKESSDDEGIKIRKKPKDKMRIPEINKADEETAKGDDEWQT